MSRVNVTGLLRRLQVKRENIYLFKILIKHGDVFAQIFSCCPKNLSCPKFGGAAAPLAPPARTPMDTTNPFGYKLGESTENNKALLFFSGKETIQTFNGSV